VSPQGGDPNATSRGERFAPTRARVGGKRKRAAFSTQEKALFRGTWWARFPGPSKVANCQSVEDCKKLIIFRDIDGATPTHSPKSGWECPH